MAPYSNQIIESKDEIDPDLYDFLAILISSKPPFDEGVTRLRPSREVKSKYAKTLNP